MTEVITFTERGMYCPAGDFYIDPWRPVGRAVITHGHADHARPGMGHYLATHAALPVMRLRLGGIAAQGLDYGETCQIGAARVSLHPAGHVPGSAQVRVEVGGEVWVVSGDYKVEADGVSEPFAPVACHSFISECTFGLPLFRWQPQAEIAAEIAAWWAQNAAEGRVSFLGAYSLGKAQRVLSLLDPSQGPILTHAAVEATNEVLRAQGYHLTASQKITPELDRKAQAGALVICPPGALASPWARRFGPGSEAMASGWMRLRGIRRRRGADRGFVISDHADWPGLLLAIKETGAENVYVTHGYTDIFARHLAELGYNAAAIPTEFGGETGAEAPETDMPEGASAR